MDLNQSKSSGSNNGRLSVGSVDENVFRSMLRDLNYSTPLHKSASPSLDDSRNGIISEEPLKHLQTSEPDDSISANQNAKSSDEEDENLENEDVGTNESPARSWLRPRKRENENVEKGENISEDELENDKQMKKRKKKKKQGLIKNAAAQEAIEKVHEVERKLIEDFDAVDAFELCIE